MDEKICLVNFFGTFLSMTNRDLVKLIELSRKIVCNLLIRFFPIIIGYSLLGVLTFILFILINF